MGLEGRGKRKWVSKGDRGRGRKTERGEQRKKGKREREGGEESQTDEQTGR